MLHALVCRSLETLLLVMVVGCSVGLTFIAALSMPFSK